jgi:dihydroorotase-like cyclic amidohydrolase
MKKTVIKQANVVNEGSIRVLDVMISNQRIEKIYTNIDQLGARMMRSLKRILNTISPCTVKICP